MPTMVCRKCGESFSTSDAACPSCGARPHPAGSPDVWATPGVRRTALVSGALIALLIVAAIAWAVATGRRTVLGRPTPVVPSAVGDR